MLQLSWAALLDTRLKLVGIFLYKRGWEVNYTHFAHCTFWRSYLESYLEGDGGTLETRRLESLIWYQSMWHLCLWDGFTCIRASWMFVGRSGSIFIA